MCSCGITDGVNCGSLCVVEMCVCGVLVQLRAASHTPVFLAAEIHT